MLFGDIRVTAIRSGCGRSCLWIWNVDLHRKSGELPSHLSRHTLDPSRKSGGALHRLHCFCLEFDGCPSRKPYPTIFMIQIAQLWMRFSKETAGANGRLRGGIPASTG